MPGYNDGEIADIAKILLSLKGLSAVRVLPYHNLAGSKYESLGAENAMPEKCTETDELEGAKKILRNHGLVVL